MFHTFDKIKSYKEEDEKDKVKNKNQNFTASDLKEDFINTRNQYIDQINNDTTNYKDSLTDCKPENRVANKIKKLIHILIVESDPEFLTLFKTFLRIMDS